MLVTVLLRILSVSHDSVDTSLTSDASPLIDPVIDESGHMATEDDQVLAEDSTVDLALDDEAEAGSLLLKIS